MSAVNFLLYILGGFIGIMILIRIAFAFKYRGMQYSWYSFKREGERIGLEKTDIRMLRDIAYRNKLPYFNSIYSSLRILDDCIINVVQQIKESDYDPAVKHQQIEDIFMLRSKMDNIFSAMKQNVTSSRKLPHKTRLFLDFEGIGHYESLLAINNPESFAVVMPLEDINTDAFSWIKKKVRVAFNVTDDAEYVMFTKVTDEAATEKHGLLFLAHTNRIIRQQKRAFKRNDANISVDIYTLRVVTSGGKKKIQVGAKTNFNGLITNLSAGGVAIRAGGTLRENTLVKLEFSLDFKHDDTVIGRVIGNSPIPNSSDRMLHIKFERITKKTRNRIFEYIYHENRDPEKYKPKFNIPSVPRKQHPEQN